MQPFLPCKGSKLIYTTQIIPIEALHDELPFPLLFYANLALNSCSFLLVSAKKVLADTKNSDIEVLRMGVSLLISPFLWLGRTSVALDYVDLEGGSSANHLFVACSECHEVIATEVLPGRVIGGQALCIFDALAGSLARTWAFDPSHLFGGWQLSSRYR